MTQSTCTVCKRREPVFFRPYSGERLCRKCFCRSVEEKVKATIAKYGMLVFDDRIMVAVSGGKDSLTLLHILHRIEEAFPKARLYAVTVDEGISGYRDEAVKLAEKAYASIGIDYTVVSFKELYGITLDEIAAMIRERGKGLTPCSYCGVLRRRAMNVAAKRAGATKLATAHTLDDEAQTFLLNVFHGDVWRIARVKPVTDPVHPGLVQRIKPMCEVPERETAMYAYFKGIGFQSTPCPYAGTALRNDIRMLLNRMEEKHPGIKYTVFRSVERLREALERAVAKEGLGACEVCGEPTVGRKCKVCEMLENLGVS